VLLDDRAGYLAADPPANIKLIGGEGSTKRSGLKSSEINALLRQVQISRDKKRNNDVVHMSLQVIHHALTQINLPTYHEAQDQPYLD
jgi:hypothetical protein